MRADTVVDIHRRFNAVLKQVYHSIRGAALRLVQQPALARRRITQQPVRHMIGGGARARRR